MDLKKDFGLRLKELRNKRGITQSKLAEMVEIDPKHMSHIETGSTKLSLQVFGELAEALHKPR